MCKAVSVVAPSTVPKNSVESSNNTSTNEGNAISAEKIWFLFGKAYDLDKFSQVHPGGLRNIMLGRGRDSTELFVSVHSTSSINRAVSVLEKYRCKEMDSFAPPQEFTFESGGLYQNILSEVNSKFSNSKSSEETDESDEMTKKKPSNKAPQGFWAMATVQLLLHCFMWYLWLFHRSLSAAAGAAALSISIGFAVFHTASHSGLSRDWRVNDFWTWLWGDLVLGFFRPLWLVHHVWGHHSYTGVDILDPDVANGKPFVRKSPETRYKAIFKYQWISSYLLYLVLPGQWLGQVIQYMRTMSRLSQGKRGKIFGVPLKAFEGLISETAMFSCAALFAAAVLVFRYGFGFAIGSLALFSMVRSFSYWVIVFPNHETVECNNAPRVSDWGEQQCRHSSNFYLPIWLSNATGGMNYQIEHHLFPAIHPNHYPMISAIVKKHCKLHNVPYNYHSSWFSALWSNMKGTYELSKMGPLDFDELNK